MRAIWKGHIQFSLVTIPVKVFSAVETAQRISFNQLHTEDFGRVAYDKRCKKCNKVLSGDEIVKGYEYEKDRYVIIDNADLEKVKVKSTKVIEIEGFVDADQVHPSLFDAPYYAGPDGAVATKTYGVLQQVLRESGKLGVGRVVLRDREDLVVIAPHEAGILMYKLRYPKEIRSIATVPLLDEVVVNEAYLASALMLVNEMTTTLAELDLRDRYNGALTDMVRAKVEGSEFVTAAEEQPEVMDIMDALEQSIKQAQAAKKPMKKVAAEKEAAKTRKRKAG